MAYEEDGGGYQKPVKAPIEGLSRADSTRWQEGSTKNPVHLSEFPLDSQKIIIDIQGLPPDVDPSKVVSLKGKGYIEVAGLIELLQRRRLLVNIVELGYETQSCLEWGCVSQLETGKYKDSKGVVYDKWASGRFKEVTEELAKPTDRMIICRVRLDLSDGRSIEMEGDGCPHTTTSMTRSALRRMASTRAMGRAGRMALGLETVLEELPNAPLDDPDGHPSTTPHDANTGEIEYPKVEAPKPKNPLVELYSRSKKHFSDDELKIILLGTFNTSSFKSLTPDQQGTLDMMFTQYASGDIKPDYDLNHAVALIEKSGNQEGLALVEKVFPSDPISGLGEVFGDDIADAGF